MWAGFDDSWSIVILVLDLSWSLRVDLYGRSLVDADASSSRHLHAWSLDNWGNDVDV